jgi:hypothetical protein
MSNKEMWEAKERYISKRNRDNRSKVEDLLTEEQIDAVEWLCKVRHDLHVNGDKVLFYTEQAEHDYYTDLVTERITDTMQEQFPDFPVIYIDVVELNDDYCWGSPDIIDQSDYNNDFDEYYLESTREIREQIERINTIIEDWLREFDEKYNTSYCPTGATRI